MTFQMPLIEQNTIAVIVAGLSAIVVKLIERWSKQPVKEEPLVTNFHQTALEEAEQIRKELREEIERHQEDKEKLRKEADKWRAKYWATQSGTETEGRRVGELETEIEALRQHVEKLLPGEDSDKH
jgi:hypothetical protein